MIKTLLLINSVPKNRTKKDDYQLFHSCSNKESFINNNYDELMIKNLNGTSKKNYLPLNKGTKQLQGKAH